MKRIMMCALAACCLLGCQEAPKGYQIQGEVKGKTDGVVYLKVFRNKMFFDVDTAEVKGGKFTFEGEVDQPLLYGLATDEMGYPVQFFLENKAMPVVLDEANERIEVKDSPVNDIFLSNADRIQEDGFNIDSLVSKYPESPAAAFYLYRYFTYKLSLDQLKATRAKLSPSLANSPYVKDLDGIIQTLEKVQIGQVAPEFSLPDADGKTIHRRRQPAQAVNGSFLSVRSPRTPLRPLLHQKRVGRPGVKIHRPQTIRFHKKQTERDEEVPGCLYQAIHRPHQRETGERRFYL